jgi:hypothetical protein
VRVCLGEEFWFDSNIAAPAGGTLGSLCWYGLPVLGAFLECVNYLVILGFGLPSCCCHSLGEA